MKITKKILLILLLLIIYVYILAINAIPNEIVVFEGEKIYVPTIFGININTQENAQSIETASNTGEKIINKVGKATLEVNLFDNFFVKNIDVDVLPKTTVIPVGKVAGVKLYTSGVLVVGMSEIEGIDNKKYKPYENSGIEESQYQW